MKLLLLLWTILLTLLPLGSLSRLPIGDVALTINDIFLPILIGAWLLYVVVIEKKVLFPPRFLWISAFAFWAGITLLFSLRFFGISTIVVAGLYLVRWLEYAMLFAIGYWLCTHESIKTRARKITIHGLFFGQLVFVIAGFAQFVLFPNFSNFVQHGWDPHYYRLLSTFLDPNFAGMFITLGLVFFLVLLLEKKRTFFVTTKSTQSILLYILLALVGIVITFSRSAYVAFALAIGLIGVFKSRKILFVMFFISIASFLFIPRVQTRIIGALEFDETVVARFNQYERTLGIILKEPVFGVGFNTFRYAQEASGYFRDDRGVAFESGHAGAGSDSSVLFVLATTGIIGLFWYGLMWAVILLDALRAAISKKNTAMVASMGFIVLVSCLSLMLHTQFVNSMFYPWIMAWMWIIIALFYSFRNDKVKE